MATLAPFVQDFINVYFEIVKCEIVPDVKHLYHYTTPQGAFGILNANEIWLTNSNYLNDSSECIHAFELCEEILVDRAKQTSTPFYGHLLEGFRENQKKAKISDVFVGSLSINGDQLSQWRGYSDNNGLSIGFDYTSLYEYVLNQNMAIYPCIYEEDKKRAMLNKFITAYARFKNQGQVPGEKNTLKESSPIQLAHNLYEMLSVISPTLKNKSFVEESEFRIISIIGKGNTETKKKFRIKNGLIVSYVPCKFNMEHINNINIGPANNAELVRKSVIEFTEGRIDVNLSQIPYRMV